MVQAISESSLIFGISGLSRSTNSGIAQNPDFARNKCME